MLGLKNKKGIGLAETIGGIIIISIISVAITSIMLNSVRISTQNKEKVVTQSAVSFYISAIKSDQDDEAFQTFFNGNTYLTTEGDTKTFNAASGDASSTAKISSLLGPNSQTYNYYSGELLKINDKPYNYSNVSITISRTTRIIDGKPIYLYNVLVEIGYLNNRVEADTYDFYIAE